MNPIRLLALDILRGLDGSDLDQSALEQLLRRRILEAFRHRADMVRAYLGETDPAANKRRIEELIRKLAMDGDAPVPFATFQERVQRVAYGFVITAHPTFSLATDLQADLMALAMGHKPGDGELDEQARNELLTRVEGALHRPPLVLDLSAEHDQSMVVLRNLRLAVRDMFGTALDIARELYPADWRRLTPRLLSLASWVGYDTDGRADILWTTTYSKRLRVQLDQLRHYRSEVDRLLGKAKSEEALAPLLELLEARLDLAIKSGEDDLELFASPPPHDREWTRRLAKTSRDMATRRGIRLTDAHQLQELVDRALAVTQDDTIARELCILRAELASQGLAAAASHLRINAVQLHNAVRKTIDMDHAPDDPTHRLTYLNAISRLIDEAHPETINFGSILGEKATAKRVFMTMVQMLKHLDRSEPIRFLIAECENAFTILTALYFAKLFGIEDRIDISPLFETRKALMRGASIIEDALKVEGYRNYVRRRGRICIQTGFSDAGRYMGQTAACVLIEKIRLGLAEVLHRHGLVDVELTIFDTHGESIGRGAHPGGFADRFRYYDTPESRRRFAAAGIRLRQETSFQGGDGYLYFLSPEGALAVVTRVLEHCIEPIGEADDPFYQRRDYVDEFFAAVEAFNAELIDDPDYADFLGAFGTNLLYPTGSRALLRQTDSAVAQPRLEHPSQLRAIPHNSILQQLGILANTIGGVGRAVAKDPDSFHELYRSSPRFRRLMGMVEHAFKFTDLDVVRAYVDLFDPGVWLRRAQAAKDGTEQEELTQVAEYLERLELHNRLSRVHRIFVRDHMDLARWLRDHRRMARDAGGRPITVDTATRDNLHMLHGMRLALIQRLMRMAVRVPDFAERTGVTHDGLITRLLHFEIEPALAMLDKIFPVTDDETASTDFGETASYKGEASQSYVTEHEKIFRPIRRDFELVRRISTGIIYHVGALG